MTPRAMASGNRDLSAPGRTVISSALPCCGDGEVKWRGNLRQLAVLSPEDPAGGSGLRVASGA